MYKRNYKLLTGLSLCCVVLSAFSVIYLHKDVFISVKSAAIYAEKNLSGNVAFNDVSSVSDWYLNYQNPKDTVRGFYFNTEKRANLEKDILFQNKIDYLLITNEHNTTMTLDLNKRPYLKEIANFSYNVNGQNFVSRIVKVL